MDSVTYEIKEDATSFPKQGNKKYYIRAGYPYNYITDNMSKREANKVAKMMRQLGFTVIDRTKPC